MADTNALADARVILDLFYLGERDYVNGLTLLEEMLAAYARLSGKRPDFIKKFQVNKWVRTDAEMQAHDSETVRRNPRLREAAVRIDLTAGGPPVTLLLFGIDDKPVDARIEEYDRAAYVAEAKDTAGGGTAARLANIGGMVDLMRGVVEVNHQYVTRTSAEIGINKGISWAYLTNFPYLGDGEARAVLEVAFDPPTVFNARGHRYTVRRVKLPGRTTSPDAEMCFFTPLPPAA